MVTIAQAWERKGEFRKQIEMAKKMLQKKCNLNLFQRLQDYQLKE
jgi:hypothetical protein